MIPVMTLTASTSGALPIIFPILAIVLGIVILVSVAKGQHKQRTSGDGSVRGKPRTAYALGGAFIVWGILAVIAWLWSAQWYAVIVLWGLGLLLGWCGFGNIRLIARCTQPIRATVEKHNRYSSRGVTTYAPVFYYRYEGGEYHIQSPHGFGYRRAARDWAVGSEVEIFLDPAAPEHLTSTRRVRVGDVLVLLLGLVFIGLGIFLLISGTPVSFN